MNDNIKAVALRNVFEIKVLRVSECFKKRNDELVLYVILIAADGFGRQPCKSGELIDLLWIHWHCRPAEKCFAESPQPRHAVGVEASVVANDRNSLS